MKGFPTELIYALLFGAALLFNFVMQRAAKRKKREAAPDEAMPDEPFPEEIPEEVWGRSARTRVDMPEPAAVVAPARRAVAPAPSRARPGRRFARQSLFGTRRKVQDAFVVAAILGRCRADEPHDIR
jgi:hypothetical protein